MMIKRFFLILMTALLLTCGINSYAADQSVQDQAEQIRALDAQYGHYTEIAPGTDIFYIDKGSGTPIIFIPGWTFSSDAFLHQVEYFSQYYRVIALDPRSQGRSSVTVTGNDYKTHGHDLAILIRNLGLKNVVLAGWSFGAFDAWYYIQQNGLSNVKAFVVIDNKPKTIADDHLGALPGQYLDNMDSQDSYRKFIRSFAENKLVTHPLKNEDELYLLAGESLRMPYTSARDLYVSGWFGDQEKTMELISQKVPSLMFLSESRVEPTQTWLKKYAPGTEIHVLGKHMMFWEFPDRFNQILSDFLKEHGI